MQYQRVKVIMFRVIAVRLSTFILIVGTLETELNLFLV